MDKQKRDHDLLECILSLLQFFQENDIPVDRSTSVDILSRLPEDLRTHTAYEMLLFMDEIPGGFMIYRADGDEEIVYVNQGLLRILQCDSWKEFQTLTGGSFRGLVHPDDLQEVEESIWRQISSSQYDLDYVEYRAFRRDGTVAWIEDYGHFVRGASEGDYFYVFLGDATEKKDQQRSERESAERRYQGLIQEYDRERALIDQEYLRRLEVIEGLSVNYESILYAELERNRILAYRLSARTVRQFGERYRMKELGWYLADYIKVWVHPEDKEMVTRETDPGYIRKKLSEVGTYYINYRVICGGELQYLQLRIVNVGGGDQVDQVVLGYRRMDEELKREMQQKQILAEALESANLAIAAKNEFLSNMSHDMRTPLNAIFGFAALAKKRLEDPKAVQSYLERVETAGKQLLDLIDKVLEATWSGAQRDWITESYDLCQTVQESCAVLQTQAKGKDLDFTLDCTGVIHSQVWGDREKLRQLVACLAGNAVTYTQPGGQVRVVLTEEDCDQDRRTYRLSVKDTGVGIGEEFLERIFEPFAREKNTTLSGVAGMGLGLTIAKYIVERMEGSIQVDSAVGRGSVFTASFRLSGGEEAPPVSSPAAVERVSGLHILLVEDNAINREIETEILQDGGYLVDIAENGKIALDKVRDSAPGTYDLILMDIQMPVMDGWQAARAIRELENPALSGIPIIALSANAFKSDVRRSLESGMDAHLAKPIDISRLMEEISRAVSRSGAENS